jgi:hypothetical protein
MDGWSPDSCEGITDDEELENADAGEERTDADIWEGQGPIWAVAP